MSEIVQQSTHKIMKKTKAYVTGTYVMHAGYAVILDTQFNRGLI